MCDHMNASSHRSPCRPNDKVGGKRIERRGPESPAAPVERRNPAPVSLRELPRIPFIVQRALPEFATAPSLLRIVPAAKDVVFLKAMEQPSIALTVAPPVGATPPDSQSRQDSLREYAHGLT